MVGFLMVIYMENAGKLGGGFKYVLFSPLFGGKIPILTNIFQLGWNHQLVNIRYMACYGNVNLFVRWNLGCFHPFYRNNSFVLTLGIQSPKLRMGAWNLKKYYAFRFGDWLDVSSSFSDSVRCRGRVLISKRGMVRGIVLVCVGGWC